ncbi:MAG: peptidase M14, partial [Acidobacteriota bacterium]|nr:peptidase M14 [Acidobacteriota bacterium]
MRRIVLVFPIWAAAVLQGAIPTPREHLGFTPGDDYKLADYAQISGYFQKLAAASDRIKVVEFGRSSLGKPMYAAFISEPENLAKLDQYRELNRQLALGLVDQAAAHDLAARGKVIVWIDSGLHASEVAPAQHSPELAYKMITDESEETRRIRANVILIQIPVINPDGLDWIVKWYRGNVGTPYELAPLPWIYQKYAGHDNNRDWFMLNLTETRAVTKLLFQDWFPEIVYNQHQAPAFPARIFVPPYSEPLNPHIPAPVMEGINLIGSAIKERLARSNQPGALSYLGYDAWWNGGLRSVPAFHNMHGILTETAGYLYATPKTYDAADFPDRFANGMPTREATVFYERPWAGGKWGVRDAIEYMLTADAAILDLAATRSSHYLLKSYEMARAAIESGANGKPYAYVIATQQWDASSASEMLERLSLAGVQVRRASAPFRANGKSYPVGTSAILIAQPFRSYVVDLMEPQKYPELKTGTTGPTKRPYDVAGWTLPLQMGVQVDRVDEPFTARWEEPVAKSRVPSLEHRENASFLAIKDVLDRNRKVGWGANGKILLESDGGFSQAAYELKNPRIGVYEPWTANIDTGWTEWVLDRYKVPYTVLHNADFAGQNLKTKIDTIILAAQSAESILHGIRQGERVPGRTGRDSDATLQRAEYTGGIE